MCSGCPDTPLHAQRFAYAHGITAAGTDDAEESERPLSQQTHEGDAGEDDPEANGEDEEEPDSEEEKEEEEADDTRGSIEDHTSENFSFSVLSILWRRRPWWDGEGHGRQASATHVSYGHNIEC